MWLSRFQKKYVPTHLFSEIQYLGYFKSGINQDIFRLSNPLPPGHPESVIKLRCSSKAKAGSRLRKTGHPGSDLQPETGGRLCDLTHSLWKCGKEMFPFIVSWWLHSMYNLCIQLNKGSVSLEFPLFLILLSLLYLQFLLVLLTGSKECDLVILSLNLVKK